MPLSKKVVAQRIKEEHRRLAEAMANLRRLVQDPRPEPEYAEWRMEVLWELRDLHTALAKRHDLEDEGGFMQELLRVAPHHAQAVHRLEQQRHGIVNELNGVIDELKQCEVFREEAVRSICRGIDELLDRMVKHDAAEGDILVSTYFQDEGSGD
ncbi:MAG: hypothetical protein D6681_14530 [Calditrichaeota bacterium]|nr:MAG: hypothetical protein D6681_14530 [Calditrichota bacterium]